MFAQKHSVQIFRMPLKINPINLVVQISSTTTTHSCPFPAIIQKSVSTHQESKTAAMGRSWILSSVIREARGAWQAEGAPEPLRATRNQPESRFFLFVRSGRSAYRFWGALDQSAFHSCQEAQGPSPYAVFMVPRT